MKTRHKNHISVKKNKDVSFHRMFNKTYFTINKFNFTMRETNRLVDFHFLTKNPLLLLLLLLLTIKPQNTLAYLN